MPARHGCGRLDLRWSGLALLGVALLGVALVAASRAAPAAEKSAIDFARDVEPILARHCHDCHGPDAHEGRLRLDARAIVFRGGHAGPAVVPGQPQQSPLFLRVTGAGDKERMPLDADPLTAAEIATLEKWIEGGAVWPEGIGSDATELPRHWAYIPPRRPPLPKVRRADWPRNPLDRFVLARLEREGLTPAPPAERARLLRRLHLDLVGLPPSVEEVEAFLRDDSPEAYERVVDRLLASPRFGERWAQPWFDMARYSDSNGYQADQLRDMWAWRDWVIAAMNDDMPFDRFTIEQIAGDLLPDAGPAERIATGMHRTPTCNVEAGVDPEENRVNQVIDRVNTTATVWLGTTLECAQCHDHKYDPFSQKDYYRLFAFFNNTPLEVERPSGKGVSFDFVGPKMSLPLDADADARLAGWQEERRALEAEVETLVSASGRKQTAWERMVAGAAARLPEVHLLEVTSFESSGGASHELLDDGSVLVGGFKPDHDIYTVTVETQLRGITGLRVEALTDRSLPQKGPGRYDRPNFILHELTVTAAPLGGRGGDGDETGDGATGDGDETGDGKTGDGDKQRGAGAADPERPVALHGATADFSQKNWHVSGAIDGDAETGWAINPQFGKPHEATFLTAAPVGDEGGTRLTFRLDQHYGGGRTIGRLRLSALTGDPQTSQAPPEIVRIAALPKPQRNKKQQRQLDDYYQGLQQPIAQLRRRLTALNKKIEAVKPPTTLVMVELDKPRMTRVMRRGDFLNPGDEVEPGVPAELHAWPPSAPPDRLGLAQWLVDRENPLVARVTVNHWWTELFGRGLVQTGEDFGTMGEPPTHPQLLDWLAVEFMERGWSRKKTLRLIVTSATYRQSSRVSADLLRRDPDNRLLARGARFRLPAESIRDNALAVSGLLSTRIGGPPVFPPQPPGLWKQTGRNEPKYVVEQGERRYRRGVYVIWRRAAPYPSFVNFDAPDRMACVVQRSRTNTPMQALTLLNDEAYVEAALALAARLLTEQPDDDVAARVARAFRTCLAREPSGAESALLEGVARRARERYRGDAAAARALTGSVQGWQPPADVDVAELAAWFHVANILLNLDEMVTRG